MEKGTEKKRFTITLEYTAYKKIRILSTHERISVGEYIRQAIDKKLIDHKKKYPGS